MAPPSIPPRKRPRTVGSATAYAAMARGKTARAGTSTGASGARYGALSKKDREYLQEFGQLPGSLDDENAGGYRPENLKLTVDELLGNRTLTFAPGSSGKSKKNREEDEEQHEEYGGRYRARERKKKPLRAAGKEETAVDQGQDEDDGDADIPFADKPSAYRRLMGLLKSEASSTRKLQEAQVEEEEDDDDDDASSLSGSDDGDNDTTEDDDASDEVSSGNADDDQLDDDDAFSPAHESDVEEVIAATPTHRDPFDAQLSNADAPTFQSRIDAVDARQWKSMVVEDDLIGEFCVQSIDGDPSLISSLLSDFCIKKRLLEQWEKRNVAVGEDAPTAGAFSPLQQRLFGFMDSYRDVMFTALTHENAKEMRELYALHALNHVFKTRDRVLNNTEKLKKMQSDGKELTEIRDQGFTRPKVLVLTPFRHTALQLIDTIIALSGTTQQENRKRLYKEFGADEDEDVAKGKPVDYQRTFEGNIDDCFRIGLKMSRKAMRLYSDFYSSDILVASPLGLRMIIGSKGDKERDFDFLSSIEMVIVDQADVLLMQNWDHVRHVFEHMNLPPTAARDTDFSRVRNVYLDGNAKYIRQTIITGAFPTPELNALWNHHVHNVSGRCRSRHAWPGSLRDVIPSVQHIFSRVECGSVAEADDARFRFFTEKTFPALRQSVLLQDHTCIVVPSYFDFIRVKNWFEAKEYSYAALSEYTSNADVSRARSSFYHGTAQYLLVTERFHFFRRYRLRGVQNVVYYALPEHAHFYSEFVNMIGGGDGGDNGGASLVATESTAVVTSLFTRYDAMRLERVVGTKRVERMVKGAKAVYMFA